MSENPVWCVMPVLAGPEMTEAALADLLGQSVAVRVLIVNQGIDDAFRDRLERLAEQDDRIFLWHHQPPLPSLSATWNRALDWIFGSLGEPCAFVVNNDVRLLPQTIAVLIGAMAKHDAYFVSAVGVTREQFEEAQVASWGHDGPLDGNHGGPDFSCYLIGADCHSKYRFDEHFIPAFCEDLDYHRRLMLAGDGSRIFSISLPYWHLASQTLKQVDPAEAARIKQSIDQHSRAYYLKKWGGPVNAETFWRPFDQDDDLPVGGWFTDPPTTPNLQRDQQAREKMIRESPALTDLSRRMLALTEIKHPQEEFDGQDDRRPEPDGRPDPTSETAGPEGDGLVSVQPGDR